MGAEPLRRDTVMTLALVYVAVLLAVVGWRCFEAGVDRGYAKARAHQQVIDNLRRCER